MITGDVDSSLGTYIVVNHLLSKPFFSDKLEFQWVCISRYRTGSHDLKSIQAESQKQFEINNSGNVICQSRQLFTSYFTVQNKTTSGKSIMLETSLKVWWRRISNSKRNESLKLDERFLQAADLFVTLLIHLLFRKGYHDCCMWCVMNVRIHCFSINHSTRNMRLGTFQECRSW